MPANQFLQAAIRQITRHGVLVDYVTVSEGGYDIESGTTINTETSIQIKAFPKRVKASQFNYPHLIGKQVVEFLVAGNAFTTKPSVQDKITYDADTYTIEGISTHTALGEVCLYKILSVKS